MNRTVYIYKNTKFNLVNMPGNESSLGEPAGSFQVNITQQYLLSSVTLPMSEADCFDIDYIKVSGGSIPLPSYYYVAGYDMTDEYTAKLNLLPDFVLCCGGLSGISFLSGTVNRITGASLRKGLIDPLFPVTDTPEIEMRDLWCTWPGEQGAWYTLVASTVDLSSMDLANTEVYSVAEDTGVVTALAEIPSVAAGTRIEIQGGPSGETVYGNTQGYGLYYYNNEHTRKAVENLRKMGMSDAILGLYRIPSTLFSLTEGENGRIDGIVCQGRSSSIFLKPIDDNDYYSSATGIKIVSLSTGSAMELSPSLMGEDPQIYLIADGRFDGCPYFIAPYAQEKHDGETEAERQERAAATVRASIPFCSVRGGTWDRAPLAWQSGDGYGLALANLTGRQNYADTKMEIDYKGGGGSITGNIGAGIDAAKDAGVVAWNDLRKWWRHTANVFVGGDDPIYTPNSSGSFDISYNDVFGENENISGKETAAMTKLGYMMMERNNEKAQELQQYYTNYISVAPTIKSQPAENLQSMYGNGISIMVTRPNAVDAENYKEIVKWFGRPTCEHVKPSYSPNGEHGFIYIETGGVTISTPVNVPRFVIEGAQATLNNGVRFWSKRPERV